MPTGGKSAILSKKEGQIMDLKENLYGLEHVGVPTADIEKTIAFYESLGFETALRTAEQSSTMDAPMSRPLCTSTVSSSSSPVTI